MGNFKKANVARLLSECRVAREEVREEQGLLGHINNFRPFPQSEVSTKTNELKPRHKEPRH